MPMSALCFLTRGSGQTANGHSRHAPELTAAAYPHAAQVINPRFSRAGSTAYPHRMQFAPSASASKGSAIRLAALRA
jgi:hypothetical protein